MIEDFRFAIRVLLKSPAYSLVALVTLALGVGATVAIFSAVYAVLLAPLPYPDPDALVVPVSTNATRGFDRASVPYADYLDWPRAARHLHPRRGMAADCGRRRGQHGEAAANERPEHVHSQGYRGFACRSSSCLRTVGQRRAA